MFEVKDFPVGSLAYLAPKQSLDVAVAQASEAGEEEGTLHNLISAWSCHEQLHILNGQELPNGTVLLRLLLGIEQFEGLAVYQSFANSLGQCGSQAVDEDAAGGVAQGLLAIVECACFEDSDIALAEVLVHIPQCKVVLTYIRYCSTLAWALRLERILSLESPHSSVVYLSTHSLRVMCERLMPFLVFYFRWLYALEVIGGYYKLLPEKK